MNVFNNAPGREDYELDEVGLREEVQSVGNEMAKLQSWLENVGREFPSLK